VSVHLLDANVLLALAWPQHVHHGPAHQWFRRAAAKGWATCPLTQLAFIRISSNQKIIAEAVTPREARDLLKEMLALSHHRFWPDDVQPIEAEGFVSIALVGHRQVNDAYLIGLAQRHGGKVATFDRGLTELAGAQGGEQRVTLIEA
jgi:uncharacterized protein